MKNYFHILKRRTKYYYSQLGEDIILTHLLKWLAISKPTYLDIGCSHPINLNNTYLLYEQGIRGTLIEPDKSFNKLIKKIRPEDYLINIGVGKENKAQRFYILKNKTLNTFDPGSFNSDMSLVDEVVDLPLKGINDVMASISPTPNLISLDIEGLQLEVIRNFDFERFKPEIFCIETQDEQHNKIREIFDIMERKGYFVCSDTYINSIFVLKTAWDNRPRS